MKNKISVKLKEITALIKDVDSRVAGKYSSYEKKQKWFNSDCQKARTVSFGCLHIYKKKLGPVARQNYIFSNQNYKKINEEAKRKYNIYLQSKQD